MAPDKFGRTIICLKNSNAYYVSLFAIVSSIWFCSPVATFCPMRSKRGSRRCYTGDMTIKRLDHVSVVVDDLADAIAFFTLLGMTIEGEAPVEGPWVDRVNGIEGVQVDIVMMRTPDGHGRLELTKFRNPKLVEIEPAIAPPNVLGLRSVMFTVESVDETVGTLRTNGAELIGEVAQYEDKYRLCYVRGPAGIIVALAEELF
ncbi:MAG TPA: VOC family protein [Pyrinomonadaceae bacterium]|nr:VOC family protein [Pyrinomonadaceae bacterium]